METTIRFHDCHGRSMSVHSLRYDKEFDIIEVSDDGIMYGKASMFGELIEFSIIKIGDHYVLHNPSKPAYTRGSEARFYLYGYPVSIEDLPCSGEDKCMLALQYNARVNYFIPDYIYTYE